MGGGHPEGATIGQHMRDPERESRLDCAEKSTSIRGVLRIEDSEVDIA